MKYTKQTLALATAILALPLCTFAQPQNTQPADTTQQQISNGNASQQAQQMVPVDAALLHTLDAKTEQPGYMFKAKLRQTAKLPDGVTIPSGAILTGRLAQDDMQTQGRSKLALVFNQAELKDGKVVPIKATIVGVFGPETTNNQGYPVTPGDQMPNEWTPATQKVDQVNVLPGVDLHSNIASRNSGVFVSTKNDDVKLRAGSELQLALGAAPSNNTNTSNTGQ